MNPQQNYTPEEREELELHFGELAVARGLVTSEDLADCQWARQKLLGEGKTIRLGEVMIARGLITKAQALEVLKAAHRAMGHNRRIGGYELLEKLGEGAMGAVYRAKQLSMDRIVALKLLPRSLSRNPVNLERFLREARTVARLNHPNIVRGFEVGEGNGYHYFAMEYVAGGTTEDRLKEEGPLPQDLVLDIGIQAAEALGHAHENGVIHRDVKPDNIMVGTGGVVKLADLGLATRDDGRHITQTGDAVGTPYYMSPEQVEGRSDIDGRTDIYALGGTLHHLATGHPPFEANSAPAIMSKRLTADPEPACSVNGAVSRELSAVLLKMMARHREERYPDTDALVEDLRLLQDGQPPGCFELAAAAPVAALESAVAPLPDAPPPVEPAGPVARRRRRFRLGLLVPPWMTPWRVGGAFVTSLLLVIGTLLWQRWEHLIGPHHPRDTRLNWEKPPPVVGEGAMEARRHWVSVRGFLHEHGEDVEAQKKALRELVAQYPRSAYAGRARRLLAALEAGH